MTSNDLFIIFGPLLALCAGFIIMLSVLYYGIEKGYWD